MLRLSTQGISREGSVVSFGLFCVRLLFLRMLGRDLGSMEAPS